MRHMASNGGISQRWTEVFCLPDKGSKMECNAHKLSAKNFDRWSDLLSQWERHWRKQWDDTRTRPKTLFDVVTRTRKHYEDMWSDILCFFLDQEGEHGLGSLFLDGLLGLLKVDATASHPLISRQLERPQREVRTESGKAIDIVVFARTAIVGIENKVTAPLHNDLREYGDMIQRRAKAENVEAFKVVLAPSKMALDVEGWVSLTYDDLFSRIKSGLENESGQGSKWSLLLRDFIDLVGEFSDGRMPMAISDIEMFLARNSNAIIGVADAFDNFMQKQKGRLGHLRTLFQQREELPYDGILRKSYDSSENPWVWVNDEDKRRNDCSALVFDMRQGDVADESFGPIIALDVRACCDGWKLIAFGRDEDDGKGIPGGVSYFRELTRTEPFCSQEKDPRFSSDGRVVVRTLPVDADLEDVYREALKWVHILHDTVKNRPWG